MDAPRIVSAVGTAAAVGGQRSELSQRIEAAMAQAVLEAYAEGITDPDQIRERSLLARAQITKAQR